MSDQAEPSTAGMRCEMCGYSLEGLMSEDVCSECGYSVALSMPRSRRGTPWQRKRGLRSLLTTWWMLFWSDECWREMRISRKSRVSFVGWCRVLSYSTLLLFVTGLLFYSERQIPMLEIITLIAFVMAVLLLVPEIVLRLYRLIMGWRISIGSFVRNESRELAAHEHVVDYASVGMLVAPIGFCTAAVFFVLGMEFIGPNSTPKQQNNVMVISGVWALVWVVAGVVLFELGYRRGWRMMRYRELNNHEHDQTNEQDGFRELDDVDHEVMGVALSSGTLSGVLLSGLVGIADIATDSRNRTLRLINIVLGLCIRFVITPIVFLVLWLGRGLDVGAALIWSLAVLVVLVVIHQAIVKFMRVIKQLRG